MDSLHRVPHLLNSSELAHLVLGQPLLRLVRVGLVHVVHVYVAPRREVLQHRLLAVPEDVLLQRRRLLLVIHDEEGNLEADMEAMFDNVLQRRVQ